MLTNKNSSVVVGASTYDTHEALNAAPVSFAKFQLEQ